MMAKLALISQVRRLHLFIRETGDAQPLLKRVSAQTHPLSGHINLTPTLHMTNLAISSHSVYQLLRIFMWEFTRTQ